MGLDISSGMELQPGKITKQNIQLLIYVKHWNLIDQHYYQLKENNTKNTQNIDNAFISIFLKSRKNYGTRKIKIMLAQQNIILSRVKISKIMRKYNLISNYTKIKYKHLNTSNVKYKYNNLLNQEFNNYKLHEFVVSDLTYVFIKKNDIMFAF